MSNYTSKDIKTLEGIEAIRLRPGMYIGGTDTDGMHHLLLEAVSNSIDECLNGYGDTIEVVINSQTREASVRDYGRGIPFGKTEKGTEALIDIVTSLHSGGKFGQGGYSVSGGLHGIGATAINALSSAFSIVSTRDGLQAVLLASKGDIISVTTETSKEKRGTLIKFVPDNTIFVNVKWDKKHIEEQLRLLSYLTVGIKFKLTYDGVEQTFLSTEGIKDLVAEKSIGHEMITGITYINTEVNDIQVEVALGYSNGNNDRTFAFTNNIPNRDGGTHVTGFRSALTSFMNQNAKGMGLLNDGDDNFSGEMVRRGIIAAISIKMKETPSFTNQTKDKLQSPSARAAVSQAVGQLEFNKKDLETIIKKILIEKKADDAAKRAREASKKVVSGGRNLNMLKDLPADLKDANKPNGELLLVEGK